MDIKSKEERSRNMSKIKSKKTSIEMYIRTLLYTQGYRYRVNYKEIEGKPDLYFIRKRTAVFIHGCFWHRHCGCKMAYTPKSNVDFWSKKFEQNMARDQEVEDILQSEGIRRLVIWECTVKKMQKNQDYKEEVLNKIETFLDSDGEERCEL